MKKVLFLTIILFASLTCTAQIRYKGVKRIDPQTADVVWEGWAPNDLYIKFSADYSACWRTDAKGNKKENGEWYGEINYYRKTVSNNGMIEYKSVNGSHVYYFRFSTDYGRLNWISPNYVDIYNKAEKYNSNRVY